MFPRQLIIPNESDRAAKISNSLVKASSYANVRLGFKNDSCFPEEREPGNEPMMTPTKPQYSVCVLRSLQGVVLPEEGWRSDWSCNIFAVGTGQV